MTVATQTLEGQSAREATGPILNQPWEDVADDVTGAIEKAVQPLLKKAVDDIYAGLLDTTQDYLKDNLAFNIASRISAAEGEAAYARLLARELADALEDACNNGFGEEFFRIHVRELLARAKAGAL